MHFFRPFMAATGRLAGAALLALLLAQWAALTHAIDHRPWSAAQGVERVSDDRWGHEVDTLACEVIDHLLTGQQTGSEPGAVQSVWAPFWIAPLSSRPTARRVWLRTYQARGPPRA